MHILKSQIKTSSLCLVAICIGLISCGETEIESHTHKPHTSEALQTVSSTSPPTETHGVTAADHPENDSTKVETRSADSHIHGGAMLSVVSEKNTVTVEFESPLFNLIGFEYQPQTDLEKQAVIKAQDILAKPQDLVIFNKAAKCVYAQSNMSIALFSEDLEESSKTDHDHHKNDHHDDEGHEDEGHHGAEHDTESSHNDVVVTYSATCKTPEKLRAISVELFQHFPNLSDLDLVYLGPSLQRSFELSNTHTTQQDSGAIRGGD